MRLPALALEVVGALERVARHRLLERLIRGRAWIGLVAFALIGIVTLQLALLKLNAGVGRALARAAVLQRENASLSIENSELGSTDHVQAKAAQLGMEFASSASLRFLSAHPRSDIAHAAAMLSAPRGAAGEEAHAASSGSSTSAAGSAGGEASASAGSEASASAGGEASASAGGEARSASETPSAQAAQGSSSAPPPAEAGSERSSSETRAGEALGSHVAPQQEAGSAGSASGGAGSATSAPGSAEATPAGGTRANTQG